MEGYSTREAAKKLGISFTSMNRYIADGKIPVPTVQGFGGGKLRIWTAADIERVRSILPKIANGRKTRHQKKHSVSSTHQSVKGRTQPRAAALQRAKETKKRKKH